MTAGIPGCAGLSGPVEKHDPRFPIYTYSVVDQDPPNLALATVPSSLALLPVGLSAGGLEHCQLFCSCLLVFPARGDLVSCWHSSRVDQSWAGSL